MSFRGTARAGTYGGRRFKERIGIKKELLKEREKAKAKALRDMKKPQLRMPMEEAFPLPPTHDLITDVYTDFTGDTPQRVGMEYQFAPTPAQATGINPPKRFQNEVVDFYKADRGESVLGYRDDLIRQADFYSQPQGEVGLAPRRPDPSKVRQIQRTAITSFPRDDTDAYNRVMAEIDEEFNLRDEQFYQEQEQRKLQEKAIEREFRDRMEEKKRLEDMEYDDYDPSLSEGKAPMSEIKDSEGNVVGYEAGTGDIQRTGRSMLDNPSGIPETAEEIDEEAEDEEIDRMLREEEEQAERDRAQRLSGRRPKKDLAKELERLSKARGKKVARQNIDRSKPAGEKDNTNVLFIKDKRGVGMLKKSTLDLGAEPTSTKQERRDRLIKEGKIHQVVLDDTKKGQIASIKPTAKGTKSTIYSREPLYAKGRTRPFGLEDKGVFVEKRVKVNIDKDGNEIEKKDLKKYGKNATERKKAGVKEKIKVVRTQEGLDLAGAGALDIYKEGKKKATKRREAETKHALYVKKRLEDDPEYKPTGIRPEEYVSEPQTLSFMQDPRQRDQSVSAINYTGISQIAPLGYRPLSYAGGEVPTGMKLDELFLEDEAMRMKVQEEMGEKKIKREEKRRRDRYGRWTADPIPRAPTEVIGGKDESMEGFKAFVKKHKKKKKKVSKISPQEAMINKGRYIYDKELGKLIEVPTGTTYDPVSQGFTPASPR